MFVLHHFNRCQIIVKLDDDSQGKRDKSDRDGHAHEIGEVETHRTEIAQFRSVIGAEEAEKDQAPQVDLAHACLVEAEQEEGFEVVIANAVTDPGAVVVHFGHANVANPAVMRALGLPVAALLAIHVLVGWRCLRDDFWPLQGRHCIR